MEIGLLPAMPTYSGGLGILAGDTLRAAADMGVPMAAVTLLHRKGYFRQHIDADGHQSDSPAIWSPEEFLEPLPPRVSVAIEGRHVLIRPWHRTVRGVTGKEVEVYYLDTALAENTTWDQGLTDYLYGGDSRYRLCQEVVLGMGGVAILRALGYHNIQTYHMNEGHSALLTLALLGEELEGQGLADISEAEIGAVRKRCVFTTHTPVAAGHDRFPLGLVTEVLGPEAVEPLARVDALSQNSLDMTYLALFFSRFVNGVAMRHRETAQAMYPGSTVSAITNGVHASTWTSRPYQELYDRHIPEWRYDNHYLRYAAGISLDEIWSTHGKTKKALLAEVERRTEVRLDPNAFTIGFARRATPYKRHDLFFSDEDRLRRIVDRVGPVQLVYGGKAHPRDEGGKAMIKRIIDASRSLGDAVKVVFLEEYDVGLGQFLTSGVDLWLNNPQRPLEASGTSGMKAALNGVPSLSILDGWWVEGWVEGVTGWAIGDESSIPAPAEAEARSLYDKLEYVVLPLYYTRPMGYAGVMRSAIALNGSFFNTHRMVRQYMANAYNLDGK
ncbi:MAG: alpha-glucan family phosphorylase [Chloroflexi bacterium]|nr:alpha-glucan family phosphorylase [Chloroflexota bacterium]